MKSRRLLNRITIFLFLILGGTSLVPGRFSPFPVQAQSTLTNPIIFVKQKPINFTFAAIPDIFGNFLGYDPGTYQPIGGNLFRLDPDGTVTNLTNMEGVAVRNPEVSFDAIKVIFSMKTSVNGEWQIYEMNVDGTNLRKISMGGANDLDPAYLPDGDIVFTSDRLKIGDRYGFLPSAQLFRMDVNGENVTQLSISPGGDFAPGTRTNGEVYFTRWDLYLPQLANNGPIDVNRFLLWNTNPDGTNDGHPIYGTHTVEDFFGMVDTRELKDGTGRFVTTYVPFFFTYGAGALAIIDPSEDGNFETPFFITNQSASTNGSNHDSGRFKHPFSIKDGRVLAAYAPGSVYTQKEEPNSDSPPNFRIVIMNSGGESQTTVYDDPEFWDLEPVEVVAWDSIPPVIAPQENPLKEYGIISCRDVYNRGIDGDADGDGPTQPKPAIGTVKTVKIFKGTFTKSNSEFSEYPIIKKEFLLETSVDADGSFAVQVPPLTPIIWEVVDADGKTLVKERFWNQVVPGEVKVCDGCHTPHDGTLGSTKNTALANLLRSISVPSFHFVGLVLLLIGISIALLRFQKILV